MFTPLIADIFGHHDWEPFRGYQVESAVVWLIYERLAVRPSMPGVNLAVIVCVALQRRLAGIGHKLCRLAKRWKRYRILRRRERATCKLLKDFAIHDIETCDGEICPICRDVLTDSVTTICKHTFHQSCLRRWLSEAVTCPVCRGNVSYLRNELMMLHTERS